MSRTSHLPELESLRSQVAELSRALAERDRSMQAQRRHLEQALQDLQEQSRLLRTIIEGTAAETGDEFFASLVTHLTAALNVQYALVAEIVGDARTRVRTLAVSAGGTLVDNFEHELDHAPCGTGLTQPFWCFEQGVQTLFPHFPRLATLGLDSHCGASLRTKDGTVIGLLIVMDTKPLRNSDRLKSLMEVFAARATSELQRYRAERAHSESERRLQFTQFAVDHAVDAVFWADDSKRFVYANDAACRSLGYSRDELLALRIPDIAPLHDPVRFQQRLDEVRQGSAATFESVHRRKDGTEFPVEVSVTYLEYEGKGYTCGIARDITDRKRVERERAQALADLHNIMETVPDILFTLDTAGNLVKWNSRVSEVTGYPPDELLNKPALAFVPDEEREQTAAAIQRAFTEGYAELQVHLLTKDGRRIAYHWTGAALKQSDGRIIGLTGVGRDISGKKRAELELTRQRQHFIEAQALAHLGSWEWDIASGAMEWSDEQFRIFGYAPQSIPVTHETFLAALLPDDHDRVLAAINHALAGIAPYDMECRIVRPTGEVRTIHSQGQVSRDSKGRPVGMSGTVLDITERKQVEEALRASEERWQLAVRGSNDGIWDWNIRTGDIFFSARWKAMRGFEDHEVADSLDEWRSRIHPEDLARVLERIDAYLAKERPEFCEEYRVQRKDGSYMWILDRGVALWADDGTPLRMAGSASDITERKNVEEKLRQTQFAMDHAVDAIYWIDPHANILYVNDAATAMLGYSREELCRMTVYDLNPNVQAAMWPGFWAETRRKRSVSLETAHRAKDGRLIPVDIRVSFLAYEGQEFHCTFVRDITERKQAHETLIKRERELRTVLDALPVGVWFTDQQGRVLYENPVGRQIWSDVVRVGLPDRDLGTYHWEHIETTELPHRWAIGTALAKGQAALNEMIEIETTDGLRKTVRNSAVPVRTEAGAMLGAIVLNEDITDRVRAEQALRQNHALLSAIMDAATDIIFVKDRHGRYVHMNRAGARTLGMTVEDVIGWNDYAVWPSDLAASCQAADRRVLETGETVTVEEAATLDGKPTVFLTTKAPYRDPEGRIIGIIGVSRDITERKRAEEALRTSEARLNEAQRIAHIGSWELDLVSNRLVWSDEVYRIFEIDPHGFGASYEAFLDLIHPDDRDAVNQAYLSSLAKRTPYQIVHRILLPNGRVKFVRERCETRYDHSGRPLVSLGTIQDITEQRRAEEALRQRERDLRAAIAERERISQDLHDGILQSLYAIGLGLESCKPLLEQQQPQQALAVMEQAIGQLNHVMAEVRNFIAGLESRVLHGGDLASALQSIVQTWAASLPMNCRIAIDDSVARRISTEQALNLLHVIREALSNSLRHGRATKATVSLKSLTRSVRLSVIDNGRGFEPARAAGIGHGLANMAARANRMGGRFAVRSKPGRGTRITIDLPKEETNAARQSETDSSVAGR